MSASYRFEQKGGPAIAEFSWMPLESVGGLPNEGVSLALGRQDGNVRFLLVAIEPGGSMAMHEGPDRSICYIASGHGVVQVDGQEDVPFRQGDCICFEPNVLHGWKSGSERTVIAVTTYP